MTKLCLFVTCLLLCCANALAQQSERMPFQMPTVSDKQIAFVYAGDIWVVDRNGGEARKLVNQAGDKVTPVFSPDGSQIAFSMNAGGNLDVYVIAVAGGEAKRLTYHPKEDAVAGWTPDGKNVLLRSRRVTDSTHQLYTISAQGGFEKQLPFPLAWEGSFSPDASRIAYTPLTDPTRTWRNYRGGQTSVIWIANLANSQTQAIPRNNSNDRNPMWIGNKIYFVSDRTSTANLFAYDMQTKKIDQLTRFEKYDIRTVSYGGDAIIFAQDGALHLYDLKTNQERTVPIKIAATDFAEIKPRSVKAARWIRAFNLSPDGKNALFGARGEVLSVSADKNEARNITQTTGTAERFPVWSPDGKWITYFSDESGEYQLHLRSANGSEVKKISIEAQPSFYNEPVWSPDSKKLAFTDKRLALWYVDIEKGAPARLDADQRGGENGSPAWSPDSRWIAYTKVQLNYLRTLHLYSLDAAKSYPVSDSRLDADSPTFDKNGKYLYFTTSANAGPRRVFGMSSFTFRTLVTRNLNAVVLRKGDVSPLVASDSKQDNAGAENASSSVDIEGIAQRIVRLPAPPRDYIGLAAGKSGVLFVLEAGNQGPNTLHKLNVPTFA